MTTALAPAYCIEALERVTRYTVHDNHMYQDQTQKELGIVTVWFGPACPCVPKGYRRNKVYLIEWFGTWAQSKAACRKLLKMDEPRLFRLLAGCRPNARILTRDINA